jgi:hypothetical protein
VGYWANVREEIRTDWRIRDVGWLSTALGVAGIVLVPWMALEGANPASIIFAALCLGTICLVGLALLRWTGRR